ncbi:unnamed protein product, partial [Didymodactylos carnosus]
MLSYNHKSKSTVSTVYNILRAENIPVWFDDRDMDDNMYDSMAEAVENASIVCCFMTPEYENSPNCKLELQHAQKRLKRIIPCMVSDRKAWKPSPSKWLDLITGSILHIDFSDTSEANIRTRVNELINRIKSQPPPPATESSKLFEVIRDGYIRNSHIQRIMNEERCFPIEQSYINLAMVEAKEQQEKEKKLEQQEKEKHHQPQYSNETIGTFEEIYGTKTSTDVKDIFKKCKDQTKKILVLGRAGIGKSTFCRYVTCRWAKGEIWSEYELVVFIQLRVLTASRYPPGPSYSLVDLVKKEYYTNQAISKKEETILRAPLDKSKVLWLLNGYDEIAQNVPTHLEDVIEQLINTTHHILTSRPYAITLSYDVKMEITGFTDDNIAKYVEQFFDQIKDTLTDDSSQSQKLLNFLKSNPNIWGVAHIPVNLELICSLWGDTDWSKMKTLTVTALYDKLIEWLCRRYLTKENSKYGRITKKAVYARCHKELEFLESLAFNAIECNTILLQPTLLQTTEIETDCSLDNYPQLLNIGILKSYDHKPTGSQIEAEKQHYFVHLSFQEHFAARHLVKTLTSTKSQTAIQFIKNNKYNQRFALVFIFASGLLTQSEYKASMDAFWSAVQSEPLDLVGLRHIKVLLECIDEIGDPLSFPQRAEYLHSIAHWLKICVSANHLIIADYLMQSMHRTTSLMSHPIIQNTFIKLLESQDEQTKLQTYITISKVTLLNPLQGLLSLLLAALGDEHDNVRNSVCKALGNVGKKSATNEVIDRLVNAIGDENLRHSACAALGNMGGKAATNEVIDRLVNTIGDVYDDVTYSACLALWNMGEKAATNEVIDRLVNALGDEDLRHSACLALWIMGEKSATNEVIDRLVNALQDKKWLVRYGACRALGNMGEKAATNEVIDGLVNALGDEDLRHSACAALGNMGEKAATNEVIDRLVNALQDKKWLVRNSACNALGDIGEKAATNEVIDRLVNALEDEDKDVRNSACLALGNMGKKAATNEVIDRLVNALEDEDKDVRNSACDALGNMGKKAETNEVISRLVNALGDEDEDVRNTACEVLGNMSEKAATNEVIDRLVNALGDPCIDDELAARALEWAVCSWDGIKQLDSNAVSKLFSCIRRNCKGTLRRVPPAQFIKVFLETGNDAWLALAFHASLLQGSAVTVVENNIVIYGGKEPVQLHVSRPELCR